MIIVSLAILQMKDT